MVAAIIDALLDQGMGDPRHLGRHGGAGLAAQVGVVRILAGVALVLVSEAVFALPDGHGGGQPIGVAQAGVAPLRQMPLPLALPAPDGREVEPAEMEILAVMGETAQIPALGEDGERDDGSHAGEGPQPLVVGMVAEALLGPLLKLLALLGEVQIALDLHPEGPHGQAVFPDGQADALAGRLVELVEEAFLGDLAADQVPGGLDEPLAPERQDGAWGGEAKQEAAEPLGA